MVIIFCSRGNEALVQNNRHKDSVHTSDDYGQEIWKRILCNKGVKRTESQASVPNQAFINGPDASALDWESFETDYIARKRSDA